MPQIFKPQIEQAKRAPDATHPPAPRKPITEADMTEAIKEQILKTPYDAANKDVFIAAVNAAVAGVAT